MNIEKMKSSMNDCLSETHEICDAFPWTDTNAYGFWLSQTYYYVAHSTRLLAASASRFGQELNKLHLRFLDHTKEERSHEILAKNDMKFLGLQIENFPELTWTASFYQRQYFLIDYVHPASLLGYILFLEGLAATKGAEVHKLVSEHYGDKAATFWSVHAEEDHGHLDSAFKQIGSLDEATQKIIADNMERSAFLYNGMLQEIISKKDQLLLKEAV